MCILQAIDGLKPELTIYWYIYIYIPRLILGSAVPGISGYITYNHIKLRAPYPNLWGFCHHGLAHLYRQLHPFLLQPPFRHEGLPTCKSPDFCAVNLISPCHVWLPKAISYSSLHPYLPSFQTKTDVEHAPFANDVPRESMGFPHFLCSPTGVLCRNTG